MRKIFFLFSLFPIHLFAQDCNCTENLRWMKTTIEENDAGYPWVMERKGVDAYQKFYDSVEVLSKNAIDKRQCLETLNTFVHFFRKGHIGVWAQQDKIVNPDSNLTTAQIIEKHAGAESIRLIDNKLPPYNTTDVLQGVWLQENYKIGIIADTAPGNRKYIGVILESKFDQWQRGMVKMEIFMTQNRNYIIWKRLDHSPVEYGFNLYFPDYFFFGDIRMYKASNEESEIPANYKYSAYSTIALTDSTLYLRIPSFQNSQQKIIATLKENQKLLETKPNLIIDLRGNGGGSDNSWKPLIPLIYTDTIKRHSIEWNSTALNHSYFTDNNPNSLLVRLILRLYLKKLRKHTGQFVNIHEREILNITQKKNLPSPRKAILIVDEHCASATEAFILAAQQSRKVTIYGCRTFGAIDISNVHTVYSPDGCFSLNYGISRTLRPSDQRYDDVGIEPDVHIPTDIPKYHWIDFVLRELEK